MTALNLVILTLALVSAMLLMQAIRKQPAPAVDRRSSRVTVPALAQSQIPGETLARVPWPHDEKRATLHRELTSAQDGGSWTAW